MLGVLVAAAAGCQPSGGNSAPGHPGHAAEAISHAPFTGNFPIRIVATTGQVAELVARVGGNHVSTHALMGPGVDPHLFRPVVDDTRQLAAADMVFYNGLHLEGRMVEMFEEMAQHKPAYAVTAGLERDHDRRLRQPPEFEGVYDPHVWHAPLLWADCAVEVVRRLSEFDPPHADEYRANADALRVELEELDRFCRTHIERIPKEHRVLVTAHDAFGYYGAAYGLEVAGLKGISTEEEKDPRRQAEIQEMILARKIPAVFVESAVAPRTIKSLVEPCQAMGHDLQIGDVLYADALGPADSDAATYQGMIRHNTMAIVSALASSEQHPAANAVP
jgi:manganese/zinc/iron transport system substrate-binding protein